VGHQPRPTAGSTAYDTALRLRATQDALRSAAAAVHPEISWSVVIGAELREPVPMETIAPRLAEAFGADPRLGLMPRFEPLEHSPGDVEAALDLAANTPYSARDPLVRIVATEDPPHLVVAAHHALLDGLGLLALIGVALGAEFQSDVRGLSAERTVRRGLESSAVGRLREALLSPPSRVAAEGGTPVAEDRLVSRELSGEPPGTSALAAATVRAVRGWNRSRATPSDRIVLAIGASLRPGSNLALEDRSAYLRLPVTSEDPSVLEQAIRGAPLEPGDAPAAIRRVAALARPAARLMAGRLGSTALVSSLGRVTAPPLVRAIHFFPVAHGPSGVSVGMASVDETTVLTVRCPRRRFSEQAAGRLADAIVKELR
jgi:hypothetical protein